jgi:hypothetical protein
VKKAGHSFIDLGWIDISALQDVLAMPRQQVTHTQDIKNSNNSSAASVFEDRSSAADVEMDSDPMIARDTHGSRLLRAGIGRPRHGHPLVNICPVAYPLEQKFENPGYSPGSRRDPPGTAYIYSMRIQIYNIKIEYLHEYILSQYFYC